MLRITGIFVTMQSQGLIHKTVRVFMEDSYQAVFFRGKK